MPICYCCQIYIADFSTFSRHLRSHNRPVSEKIQCMEQGKEERCKENFANLYSFKRHLMSQHPVFQDSGNHVVQPPPVPLNVNEPHVNYSHSENIQESQEEEVNYFEEYRKIHFSFINSFICKLYSDPSLPRSKVQDVQDYTQILFNDSLSRLQKEVEKIICSQQSQEEKLNSVKDVFLMLKEPFETLKTEHLRFKYFKSQGTFHEPISVPLRHHFKPHDTSAGFYLENEPISAQVIPLAKVLKSFIEAPGVIEKLRAHIKLIDSENTVMSNFMQGTLWRDTLQKIKAQYSTSGENVLHWPFFLFSDDYNCGDGFGSHKDDNKLCGVYVSLPFLPPQYRSMLNNIFLFGLFYSSEKKALPNKELYTPFLEELKSLCNTGISVETPKFRGVIKFHLGLFLGDNLGLHQITDFLACFVANFPCMYCKCHREVTRTQLTEDLSEVRDILNYNESLLLNDPSETGIRAESLWNELPFVHVTKNSSVDVMHDFPEGVCKFDLKLIVNYALDNNYATVDQINNRILHFNYGLAFKTNKPTQVIPKSNSKVKFSASSSETLNFCLFFGLLMGDFFPQGDPVWDLYCVLRKIMDIVFAPCINRKCLNYLKDLIAEHNKLFILWSEKHQLKPKMHNLVHYVRLTLQFGPLIHAWVMRMEAKHQQGKKVAVSVATTRNLPKTIALRHQLIYHCYLQSGDVLSERFECGRMSTLDLTDFPFLASCEGVPRDLSDGWDCVSWVSISGTRYQPSMVLVLPFEDLDPEFGIIKGMFVSSKQKVGFACQRLQTLYFDTHVHCHRVEFTNDFTFVMYDSLCHYLPSTVATDSNGNSFVPYRYGI